MGFWLLIILITSFTFLALSYWHLPRFKGNRALIILLGIFPVLWVCSSVLLVAYVYPSPPPYNFSTFLNSAFVAIIFSVLFLRILLDRAVYAWLNNEEAFEKYYIPKDGKGTHLVFPNRLTLMSRALYVCLWYYGAWLSLAGIVFATVFNSPMNSWFNLINVAAGLLLLDIAVLRLFPRCAHCGFGILALNAKRQCFKESRRLLFQGECTCVNCGAHYFLSAEKLQRYQASHPTPVSPNSQNIQP